MSLKDSIIGISFVALMTAILIYAFLGYPEVGFVRPLGEFYLYNTFNFNEQGWWSASPNAVTGVLWDYRGYDTLYETMVFYVGIVAIALFFEKESSLRRTSGMTVIVRATTKLVFVFILTSAMAITIFSVKTPGGGFQGGSIMAIAYIAIIIALSRGFLPELRMDLSKAHLIKIFGLILIFSLTVIPVAYSLASGTVAYALQNQPKPWSEFGYPTFLGLYSLSGGMVIPIQVGELVHVGMGFTIMFLILTEREGKKELGGKRS
ncbi:MAG: MnhB domain-containing protein [Candidatus Verstraetearchaeota archaeon]|nr:MnhB domain-containing protein [Candidatus Verstraetearchaeota archaeon]